MGIKAAFVSQNMHMRLNFVVTGIACVHSTRSHTSTTVDACRHPCKHNWAHTAIIPKDESTYDVPFLPLSFAVASNRLSTVITLVNQLTSIDIPTVAAALNTIDSQYSTVKPELDGLLGQLAHINSTVMQLTPDMQVGRQGGQT